MRRTKYFVIGGGNGLFQNPEEFNGAAEFNFSAKVIFYLIAIYYIHQLI
jgi:hypothetical protein